MSMPMNFVLVRHGQSEGNAAKDLARAGRAAEIPKAFYDRHSSEFHLTNKGSQQAQIAGAWIRENIGSEFFRYYASPYVRAIETAALLGLPDAAWLTDFYLRERDWGELDNMPEEERQAQFAEELARCKTSAFFWPPPSGESMANACLRTTFPLFDTLHRECESKDVIVVCHGEVMWDFRIRLERMSFERYNQLDGSKDPRDRIHNCQILHYTRIDPHTKVPTPHLGWMRSVCPTDLSLSRNTWEEIQRPRYTNQELLDVANQYPRFIA